MLSILRISWRSLWRTRRRTLLNAGAVGFGLALLLFYSGILTGMMNDAQNDLGNTGMGHIEIYAKDYRSKKDARHLIADPERVARQLAAGAPPESHVGWRVLVQGLASSAWGSRGVRLLGVNPAQEAQLSHYFTTLREGEVLRADDPRGIVIGEGLAQRLKLKVKSKVRVMTQRVDGEMGAEMFRVRGIFRALSPAVGKSQAFVTADAARRLLGVDAGAHQVLAQLPRASLAGPLEKRVEAELGERYEVLSFAELFPALAQFERIISKVELISILAVYLLVGLGILNTMLMSVMERTREFGVMMAVGTRRWRLTALVLGEAFWIGAIGVALGSVAGVGITWACAEYGLLDWSESIGAGMDFAGSTMAMVIRPVLEPLPAVRAALVVWLLTLMVGFYPAWRVSRLCPADAVRAN